MVILALPPWLLMTIPSLPTLSELPRGVETLLRSGQTLRRGGLPTSGLISLTVAIIWLSWLRVGLGFLGALGRVISNRPIRRPHRWAVKLAFWGLMVTPTVVAVMVPVAVSAMSSTLETSEKDFRAQSVSTPHILISALVASGVLYRLRSQRLHRLRQETKGPPEEILKWETAIQHENEELIAVRLELAVRALLKIQATSFRMILRGRDGNLLVEFPHDRLARPPWSQHGSRIWRLESSITLEQLAEHTRSQSGSIPLLLPVGDTTAGEVWINLQQVKVFAVHGDGQDADRVWRGLCQSLALSPFTEHVSMLSIEEQGLRGRREIVISNVDQAGLIAEQLHSEEAPALILDQHRQYRDSLVSVLHRQRPLDGEFGMSLNSGRWLLHPTMTEIEPHRCTDVDLETLDSLVETPLTVSPAAPLSSSRLIPNACPVDFDPIVEFLSPHRFIVSVLGIPHIRHVTGKVVSFERSRSEELVIWLALHPSQQRRSVARAEMWSVAIKDATFSNVTSDVRRSLTLLEHPPCDSDWLGVTLTDELPLHPLMVSDANLLSQCLEHARRRPEDHGLEVLEYGLGLVTGAPFSSSTYLWRDTTGLGTEYAMLVVRAALLLADLYIERGDTHTDQWRERVYWATSQGLLAVPGHEDLVVRRLEMHAHNGDQAALCAEWQAYCRALASDDWGDASPSPKMVDVWRRLSGGV